MFHSSDGRRAGCVLFCMNLIQYVIDFKTEVELLAVYAVCILQYELLRQQDFAAFHK